MKEILEILTEDLTVKKAVRLKKSSKTMSERFVKRTLIPYTLVIGVFLLILFAVIVISSHYSPEMFSADRDFDKILKETGASLIFLLVGVVMGLLMRQSDMETAVKKIVDPVIETAIDDLEKDEGEESSDNATETGIEPN